MELKNVLEIAYGVALGVFFGQLALIGVLWALGASVSFGPREETEEQN